MVINNRDLERAVEDLSELLEYPIEDYYIPLLRQRVTDKSVCFPYLIPQVPFLTYISRSMYINETRLYYKTPLRDFWKVDGNGTSSWMGLMILRIERERERDFFDNFFVLDSERPTKKRTNAHDSFSFPTCTDTL